MFSQLFSYIAFSGRLVVMSLNFVAATAPATHVRPLAATTAANTQKASSSGRQWLGDESREWGVHDHQEWESPLWNQHRAWKWMVGILVSSFWDGLFFRGYVRFRECSGMLEIHERAPHFPYRPAKLIFSRCDLFKHLFDEKTWWTLKSNSWQKHPSLNSRFLKHQLL